MTKPTLGRVVHTVVDPRQNNGQDVASALITKVNEVEGGDPTVNLRVFLDSDENLWLTNVPLVDKRPTDDEESEDTDEVVTTPPSVKRVAFWPPRS